MILVCNTSRTLFHSGASNVPSARNCQDVLDRGGTQDGIYTIEVFDIHYGIKPQSLQVYCDQETDGGGWLVSELLLKYYPITQCHINNVPNIKQYFTYTFAMSAYL